MLALAHLILAFDHLILAPLKVYLTVNNYLPRRDKQHCLDKTEHKTKGRVQKGQPQLSPTRKKEQTLTATGT
jgi:hypothetical protein